MRKISSALIVIVLVLLAIGIVMLASTSSIIGMKRFDDPHHFVKLQAMWLIISICIAAAVSRVDYHWWQKLAVPLYVLSVILLIMVFVPHFGHESGGGRRWIRIAGMSLQPSELGKFAVNVCLAAWMVRVGRKAENLKEGLLIPGAGLGIILVLTILEPDFGTTFLVGAAGIMILYAGGTRISYLSVVVVGGLCLFVIAVMLDPVRLGRVLAFLMPDKYSATAYHLTQSKAAFISGGAFGVGLGNSMQKQLYLPEAHTDFILAIIGEELGFAGTFSVLLLFIGILVCGLTISLKAPDYFGRLLAFGMTMLLILQAAINIAVVTGCMPTKGLPLPLISYGGSSMMNSLACIGVLLNIASHSGDMAADEHVQPIKDSTHRF
jgi:cell division protein FtsW